ncbi:hypothetical protein GDO81_003855 [Engystomops pustulosus]|uniref:Uncharacterized protein n=1 Tax=Engystomops pustulosus TaxID=76066 RepID=A0AAV6ZZB2_ENGPU|nr:hypothetical protein GDO81_003855 [Engystomops pustulosus]
MCHLPAAPIPCMYTHCSALYGSAPLPHPSALFISGGLVSLHVFPLSVSPGRIIFLLNIEMRQLSPNKILFRLSLGVWVLH